MAGSFGLSLLGMLLIILLMKDPTPVLSRPGPNVGVLFGLVGGVGGLWSAYNITRLPAIAGRSLGKFALWIMLPLWLAFGLGMSANRLAEAYAFRNGGTRSDVILGVLSKKDTKGRRGRHTYTATVISPAGGGKTELTLSRELFARLTPYRDCLQLAVETTAKGAMRAVGQPTLTAACP
jgi:hypothetical protein